jgi:hypothetical protein
MIWAKRRTRTRGCVHPFPSSVQSEYFVTQKRLDSAESGGMPGSKMLSACSERPSSPVPTSRDPSPGGEGHFHGFWTPTRQHGGLPQNRLAPNGWGCERQLCRRPRNWSSQRKRDRAITFLLPSCFLTLSGFHFNPLGDRPQPHPWGCSSASFLGMGPCCASPRVTS